MTCPHCPHCNLQLIKEDSAVQAEDHGANAHRLRSYCRAMGIPILPVDLVREHDAATLMGLAAKTLRNRRSDLDPTLPSHIKRGRTTLYFITSIAAWHHSFGLSGGGGGGDSMVPSSSSGGEAPTS